MKPINNRTQSTINPLRDEQYLVHGFVKEIENKHKRSHCMPVEIEDLIVTIYVRLYKIPECIEFKWDRHAKTKNDCDTQHMLYLLQISLNSVLSPHIITPHIITNILLWHNSVYDNCDHEYINKFDGQLLEQSEKEYFINEILVKIGQMPLEIAQNVYHKLKHEVIIDTEQWLELPQPKLKLKSWYSKMYINEKVLSECTVEEVIKLLTYKNPQNEYGECIRMEGVFASVIQQNSGYRQSALQCLENWEERVVHFFRDTGLDGQTLIHNSVKTTVVNMMLYLMPKESVGRIRRNHLRGGCNQILSTLKKCDVHKILSQYQ
eukprot:74916_1